MSTLVLRIKKVTSNGRTKTLSIRPKLNLPLVDSDESEKQLLGTLEKEFFRSGSKITKLTLSKGDRSVTITPRDKKLFPTIISLLGCSPSTNPDKKYKCSGHVELDTSAVPEKPIKVKIKTDSDVKKYLESDATLEFSWNPVDRHGKPKYCSTLHNKIADYFKHPVDEIILRLPGTRPAELPLNTSDLFTKWCKTAFPGADPSGPLTISAAVCFEPEEPAGGNA